MTRDWQADGRPAIGCRIARWGRRTLYLSAVLTLLVATARPARAVMPSEMLPDPALESRAERIGQELRCLVCRNQSIEDSQADLAHDLRMLVRRRLLAGDSNAQVIAYIRSRYGDYVLLDPPFETATWLLWGGPPLVLLCGAIAVARLYRRRRIVEPAALTADEQERLVAALGEAGER